MPWIGGHSDFPNYQGSKKHCSGCCFEGEGAKETAPRASTKAPAPYKEGVTGLQEGIGF